MGDRIIVTRNIHWHNHQKRILVVMCACKVWETACPWSHTFLLHGEATQGILLKRGRGTVNGAEHLQGGVCLCTIFCPAFAAPPRIFTKTKLRLRVINKNPSSIRAVTGHPGKSRKQIEAGRGVSPVVHWKTTLKDIINR